MWVLLISFAMAPHFVMETHRSEHKTEALCKRALAQSFQLLAQDGIILIGKCEPKKK